MSFEEQRKDIDDIDSQIARLIAKRVRIAEDIGKRKITMRKPVEDMAIGPAEVTVWSCDFSYKYVEINAEYHT